MEIIYSINFSGLNGDEFYFTANPKQVEKIERETPYLINYEWENDESGQKFMTRINKHLFTYSEIRNKIKVYQDWGKN